MNQTMILKSAGFISRGSMSYLDRALREFGLGSGTYPALLCLGAHGPINQSRLSEELAVDKAWTTRAVRRLLSLGYVAKRTDPADSRACLLSISEKGRDVVPRVKEELRRWNALLCEGLDPEDLALVDRCLAAIAENARRHRSEPGKKKGETAE